MWSTIEANVGIICASLMVMKPLIVKAFPRLLDSTGSSRQNLRLPTIQESTSVPWVEDWGWGSRSTECRPSRITSWIDPPSDADGILVTKKSVVEANWTSEDMLGKPQRAFSRDSCI